MNPTPSSQASLLNAASHPPQSNIPPNTPEDAARTLTPQERALLEALSWKGAKGSGALDPSVLKAYFDKIGSDVSSQSHVFSSEFKGPLGPPPAPDVRMDSKTLSAYDVLASDTSQGLSMLRVLSRHTRPNAPEKMSLPQASLLAFLLATVGDDSSGVDVQNHLSDLFAKVQKNHLQTQRQAQQQASQQAEAVRQKTTSLRTMLTVANAVTTLVPLGLLCGIASGWAAPLGLVCGGPVGAAVLGTLALAVVVGFVVGGFSGNDGTFQVDKAFETSQHVAMMLTFPVLGVPYQASLTLIEAVKGAASIFLNWDLAEAQMKLSSLEWEARMHGLVNSFFQDHKKQVDDTIQTLIESYDRLVEKTRSMLDDAHRTYMRNIGKMVQA